MRCSYELLTGYVTEFHTSDCTEYIDDLLTNKPVCVVEVFFAQSAKICDTEVDLLRITQHTCCIHPSMCTLVNDIQVLDT